MNARFLGSLVLLAWLSLPAHARQWQTAAYLHSEAGSQMELTGSLGAPSGGIRLPVIGYLPDDLKADASYPFLSLAPSGLVRWSAARTTMQAAGAARYHASRAGDAGLQYAYARLSGLWTIRPTLALGLETAAQHVATGLALRLYRDGPLEHDGTGLSGLTSQEADFWMGPYLRWDAGADLTLALRGGVGHRLDRRDVRLSRNAYFVHGAMNLRWSDRWSLRGTLYTWRRSTTTGPRQDAWGSLWQLAYLPTQATRFLLSTEMIRRDVSALFDEPLLTDPDSDGLIRRSRSARVTQTTWITGLGFESDAEAPWTFSIHLDWIRSLNTDLLTDLQPYSLQLSVGARYKLHGGKERQPSARALWEPLRHGIRFAWPAEDDAPLYLVGDFNNWALPGLPLRRGRDGYHTRILDLPPGTYAFKVLRLVDGRVPWVPLPPHVTALDDGFGGLNGLLVIPNP